MLLRTCFSSSLHRKRALQTKGMIRLRGGKRGSAKRGEDGGCEGILACLESRGGGHGPVRVCVVVDLLIVVSWYVLDIAWDRRLNMSFIEFSVD